MPTPPKEIRPYLRGYEPAWSLHNPFFSKASYFLGVWHWWCRFPWSQAQVLGLELVRCISLKLPVLRRKVLMPHCRRLPKKKKKRFKRVVDDPDSNQKKTHFSRELGCGCFIIFYVHSCHPTWQAICFKQVGFWPPTRRSSTSSDMVDSFFPLGGCFFLKTPPGMWVATGSSCGTEGARYWIVVEWFLDLLEHKCCTFHVWLCICTHICAYMHITYNLNYLRIHIHVYIYTHELWIFSCL